MKSISTKSKYTLLAIIAAGSLISIWAIKSQGAEKQESIKPVVQTITVSLADKSFPLEIAGFVRGENRADISPMASGRILRIFKHEGESVRKGEVMATIEASQSDAQIEAANASIASLEKTLSDSAKYYDQLVDQAKAARDDDDSDTADEMVESAKKARNLQIQATKNQLIAAQGSLNIAKTGRNNSTLLAPFAGTITAVHAREGGFANFSMPLVSLSTQKSFEIETYVSPANARSISAGSIASFNSQIGEPISAIVTAVAPGADSLSLKTLVRLHLETTDSAVAIGEFLHGQIMIPRKQAGISIPKNAIVSRGGDQIVFVLNENNVAQEQSVKLGVEHEGSVEVLEGINENQKIVIEGQQYLTNGSATKPYEKN